MYSLEHEIDKLKKAIQNETIDSTKKILNRILIEKQNKLNYISVPRIRKCIAIKKKLNKKRGRKKLNKKAKTCNCIPPKKKLNKKKKLLAPKKIITEQVKFLIHKKVWETLDNEKHKLSMFVISAGYYPFAKKFKMKKQYKYTSRFRLIMIAGYNKRACKYFDELNLKNGWNLIHAENGGEVKVLQYSLDAFDKDRNIVVEYDEPSHYTKKRGLKESDVIRQNAIMKKLDCKFYRYDERNANLYEVKISSDPLLQLLKR